MVFIAKKANYFRVMSVRFDLPFLRGFKQDFTSSSKIKGLSEKNPDPLEAYSAYV